MFSAQSEAGIQRKPPKCLHSRRKIKSVLLNVIKCAHLAFTVCASANSFPESKPNCVGCEGILCPSAFCGLRMEPIESRRCTERCSVAGRCFGLTKYKNRPM